MTEAEAKAKWCPFARTKTAAFSAKDGDAVASCNRDFDGEPVDMLHTCIGSACMAWRWRTEPQQGRRLNPDKESPLDRPGDGYCGLAGVA